MKNKLYPLLALLSTVVLLGAAPDDCNATKCKDWIFLPFAFSSDSTGFAGGISAMKRGMFNPQSRFVATAFTGLPKDVIINGQKDQATFSGGFVSFLDLKLPYTDRLFFSLVGLKSYLPQTHYYIDGSHTSDKDDAFITSGDLDFFTTTFRYTLPIGEGIDNPAGLYRLKEGFCVGREDCGGGKPFITGSTSIGIKTFFQTNNTDNTEMWKDSIWWENGTSVPTWNSNGLRFFLTHDNTDFNINPSRGYHFQLQYSKDFGWGDSLQSWDFLEFKYNHYFDLDTFSFTKQNVLALSLWSGYSFSWDNDNEISPGFDAHRPPMWEGARLGGFNRMRGYDHNRFSDKAAFYAAAEYRAVIDYNPLKDIDWIPMKVDWFQAVLFAEAGRVHDQYTVDLVSDMKYDAGVSLRAMISELPIRLDVAYGEEGTYLWLMAQHPFDF
ncbi:MAG TPA: BamA/TamA family outer membrane protein [Sulfurovum sp.]|uniref:BamA/TamA family outer membrane protein n=1 Tax=Sulfurovum sp. TaxID=1969726 RepID=UPI002F93F543